ncbi:MAG: hypothetical protein ABIF87_13125 [Pseudomonadota bacterium]
MCSYFWDRYWVNKIFKILRKNESCGKELITENTVIYKLVLPPEKTISVQTNYPDSEPKFFKRGLGGECLGLGLKIFYVDSDPLAIPGKPTAYFVFKGPFLTHWGRVDESIVVAGQPVASIGHNPSFQRPVGGATQYYNLLLDTPSALFGIPIDIIAQAAPQPAHVQLSPLTYPLPPTDKDDDSTVKNEPGTKAGDAPTVVDKNGNPCKPIYLAVGLVFQGPEDSPGTSDPHSLFRETGAVLLAFGKRGYNEPHADRPPIIKADEKVNKDIDSMINTLANGLPGAFCDCPPDQLVLVISAHGYGPSLADSEGHRNTNKVPAMHFVPGGKGKKSWVTHAELAEKIGNMLAKKGIDPAKVFTIIYSCRAGDAFKPERYGKYMKGSLIITPVSDADTLIHPNTFMRCLKECIEKPEVKTWADLTKCIKDCMSKLKMNNKPYGRKPRTGRPPK